MEKYKHNCIEVPHHGHTLDSKFIFSPLLFSNAKNYTLLEFGLTFASCNIVLKKKIITVSVTVANITLNIAFGGHVGHHNNVHTGICNENHGGISEPLVKSLQD